jgi:arginine decarboxylase
MQSSYLSLIKQSVNFPQEGFDLQDDTLVFNDVPLIDIIHQYKTPLKISYIPKISQQIQKARKLFQVAMAKADYKANYYYCYCTKSSHFQFVLEEVLKNQVHIETSSAFDIPIIKELHARGLFNKDTYIICNGYKRRIYKQYITELINEGFK